MNKRAISLFTGAGGLDFGFEAAGFETAVVLEFDKTCCINLRANRKWPIIEDDINNVSAKHLLKVARLRVREADILIGGPPCQPYSKSGYWANGDSRRLTDKRAPTLDGYLRILEETLPKAFLLENVVGFIFRNKDEALRKVLKKVRQINKKHGTKYNPTLAVLNASHFGVPQIRERVFIVGSRDGLPFEFPVGEFGTKFPVHTAWDALHDLKTPVTADLLLSGKWADLLPSIPEGNNYSWHTDRGGGKPLFGWRRRYWNFLLKLAKDMPSWTIQAQPGPATGPFHWDNRKFSAIELASLQTFPKGLSFIGSPSDVQRMIGNAVPSLLAEVLAKEIDRQLLGGNPRRKLKLMPVRADRTPAPNEPKPVAHKYLKLAGTHAEHPGTGLGNRAKLFDDTLEHAAA